MSDSIRPQFPTAPILVDAPLAAGERDDHQQQNDACATGHADDSDMRRFRATVECAPVGIAHVHLDGRWLWMNDRLCTLVGYSREELLAGFFQDITYADDLTADLAYVERMLRGELDMYAMDKRYRHKDGTLLWAHLTVSLVRAEDGSPQYFISVIEDINERKRLEDGLRQAMDEQGRLLGIVGHEMGNPLTTLKARTQMLTRGLTREQKIEAPASSAAAAREHLAAMQRAIAQLERQVDDLRTVANVAQDNLPMSLARCDLRELCRQTVAEQRLIAAGRRIEFDSPPAPVEIMADSMRIRQVVTNLLTNALKYSSADRAVRVALAQHAAERTAALEIRDEGPGIPAEAIAHLFERFYRVPGITAQDKNAASMGLGLFITRAIVERHGGSISVESAVGHGSTFRVVVPLAPLAEEQPAE